MKLIVLIAALKTSPSRRRNRKSIGEEGEKEGGGGVSARDVQPIVCIVYSYLYYSYDIV